jgi:hypothetical protein
MRIVPRRVAGSVSSPEAAALELGEDRQLAIQSSSVCDEFSASVGLSGNTLDSEISALATLNAVMDAADFWNPQTLAGVSNEAVQCFIDQVAAKVPRKRDDRHLIGGQVPPMRSRVEMMRELRSFQVTRRAREAYWVLEGAPRKQNIRRALAYAANLPMELTEGTFFAPEHPDFEEPALILGSSLTWLPDGLSMEGVELMLPECRMKSLPHGLRCKSLNLMFSKIEALPSDLEVEKDLVVLGSPLVRFTESELRGQAPGVVGRIFFT